MDLYRPSLRAFPSLAAAVAIVLASTNCLAGEGGKLGPQPYASNIPADKPVSLSEQPLDVACAPNTTSRNTGRDINENTKQQTVPTFIYSEGGTSNPDICAFNGDLGYHEYFLGVYNVPTAGMGNAAQIKQVISGQAGQGASVTFTLEWMDRTSHSATQEKVTYLGRVMENFGGVVTDTVKIQFDTRVILGSKPPAGSTGTIELSLPVYMDPISHRKTVYLFAAKEKSIRPLLEELNYSWTARSFQPARGTGVDF